MSVVLCIGKIYFHFFIHAFVKFGDVSGTSGWRNVV